MDVAGAWLRPPHRRGTRSWPSPPTEQNLRSNDLNVKFAACAARHVMMALERPGVEVGCTVKEVSREAHSQVQSRIGDGRSGRELGSLSCVRPRPVLTSARATRCVHLAGSTRRHHGNEHTARRNDVLGESDQLECQRPGMHHRREPDRPVPVTLLERRGRAGVVAPSRRYPCSSAHLLGPGVGGNYAGRSLHHPAGDVAASDLG